MSQVLSFAFYQKLIRQQNTSNSRRLPKLVAPLVVTLFSLLSLQVPANAQPQLYHNTKTGTIKIRGTNGDDFVSIRDITVVPEPISSWNFIAKVAGIVSPPPYKITVIEVITDGVKVIELPLATSYSSRTPDETIRRIEFEAGEGNDQFHTSGIAMRRCTIAVAGEGGDDTIIIGSPGEYGQNGEPVVVYGGFGNDKIVVNGNRLTQLYGGYGEDEIWGGSMGDIIFGNDQDDDLYGRYGDDTIYGGNGLDRIVGDSGSNFVDPGQDGLPDIISMSKGDNVFLVHMEWQPVFQRYVAEKDAYYDYVYSSVEYPILVYHGGPKDTNMTGHWESKPGTQPISGNQSHIASVSTSTAWDSGETWSIPEQELFVTEELTFTQAMNELPQGYDPYTAFYATSLVTHEAKWAVRNQAIQSEMLLSKLEDWSTTADELPEFGDDFLGVFMEPADWWELFLSEYFHELLIFCGTLEINGLDSDPADFSTWNEMLSSDLFSMFEEDSNEFWQVSPDSGTMLSQNIESEPTLDWVLEISTWTQPTAWISYLLY